MQTATTHDQEYDAGPLARNPLFAFMDDHGDLLTAKEEARIARKARDGCRRSRNTLIERNMRLVVDLARKSGCHDEHELLDRIQSGSIGLLRAAEKFDPDRGFAFSTYATWWVRQAVSRERDAGHPMGVPLKLASDLRGVASAFAREHGREPSLNELAGELHLDRDQVAAAQAAMRPHSLDVGVGEDGDTTLGGLLSDPDALDPANVVERIDLREQVATHLARLNGMARRLIELRYGLETGGPETLEHIAARFGITLNHARRLEADAMRTLQEGAAPESSYDESLEDAHGHAPTAAAAALPSGLAAAFRAAMFGDPPAAHDQGVVVPA